PLLAINGAVATLTVGSTSLSYTFAGPLNTGLLGVGVNNAVATFTWIEAQIVPRVFTYQFTQNFSASTGPQFSPQAGTWNAFASGTSARYYGTPSGTTPATSVRPFTVDPSSYVEYQAIVNTRTTAGLIFAYTSPNDFIYAEVVAGTNQVILGHRTPAGWF